MTLDEINKKLNVLKEKEKKLKNIKEIKKDTLGILFWWVYVKQCGKNQNPTKLYQFIKTKEDLANYLFQF